MRLNEHEKSKLYHLAIEELYNAEGVEYDVVDALKPPPLLTRLVTPADSRADIDASVKLIARERERFLSGMNGTASTVRPRILSSIISQKNFPMTDTPYC